MTTLYMRQASGGVFFVPERKAWGVDIPAYAYDLWMPLIGIGPIAVYGLIWRLARDGKAGYSTHGIGLKTLAVKARMGDKTLVGHLKLLDSLGFIRIVTGNNRKSNTYVVLDIPKIVPSAIIKKYMPNGDYEPLTPWLVDDFASSSNDAGSSHNDAASSTEDSIIDPSIDPSLNISPPVKADCEPGLSNFEARVHQHIDQNTVLVTVPLIAGNEEIRDAAPESNASVGEPGADKEDKGGPIPESTPPVGEPESTPVKRLTRYQKLGVAGRRNHDKPEVVPKMSADIVDHPMVALLMKETGTRHLNVNCFNQFTQTIQYKDSDAVKKIGSLLDLWDKRPGFEDFARERVKALLSFQPEMKLDNVLSNLRKVGFVPEPNTHKMPGFLEWIKARPALTATAAVKSSIPVDDKGRPMVRVGDEYGNFIGWEPAD